MIQAMILAHLLGDFVFQVDALARWKNHSLWGVVAHAAIVTVTLWACSLPFTLDWWPYALAVGAVHILLDFVRVKIGSVRPMADLLLLLIDQAAHVLAIVVALAWSGWLGARPAETAFGVWLQTNPYLTFVVGYVFLAMPAWVLVYFLVRAMGVESTSLPGRPGERYVGMVERGLIATLVLAGQYLFVPLVVVPRLVVDWRTGRLAAERYGYLGELLISASLAVAVGLLLRGLI